MINDMDLKLSIGKKYHTNMNQAGMILYKMELKRKMYAFPGHNLLIPVLILFVADLFRSIIVIFNSPKAFGGEFKTLLSPPSSPSPLKFLFPFLILSAFSPHFSNLLPCPNLS